METVVTDRRHAPRRRTLDEHGVVSARVRPGHEVALIDISAGGALIECMRGLSPGSIIELHVTAGGRRASVRGRVLRCAVVQLQPTSVCYRGAIGFDADLRWFVEPESAGRSRDALQEFDNPKRGELVGSAVS
jgi:hypothetical protein